MLDIALLHDAYLYKLIYPLHLLPGPELKTRDDHLSKDYKPVFLHYSNQECAVKPQLLPPEISELKFTKYY